MNIILSSSKNSLPLVEGNYNRFPFNCLHSHTSSETHHESRFYVWTNTVSNFWRIWNYKWIKHTVRPNMPFDSPTLTRYCVFLQMLVWQNLFRRLGLKGFCKPVRWEFWPKLGTHSLSMQFKFIVLCSL